MVWYVDDCYCYCSNIFNKITVICSINFTRGHFITNLLTTLMGINGSLKIHIGLFYNFSGIYVICSKLIPIYWQYRLVGNFFATFPMSHFSKVFHWEFLPFKNYKSKNKVTAVLGHKYLAHIINTIVFRKHNMNTRNFAK